MIKYYIGNDFEERLSDVLKSYGANKALLVRGRGSYDKCGARELVASAMTAAGCSVVEFSDFTANPRVDDIRRGEELCLQQGCDIILAVGGGSVMDSAKLIRQHIAERTGVVTPLIAAPTTAGTGAEATRFSVCCVNGEKQSFIGEHTLPDRAIVSPRFTYLNDAYLTACTGFDAVAQAIESYWSVSSTAESLELAEKSLSLLWRQLPELVNHPEDKELRDMVSEGAFYSGLAIDITATTAPHALSYRLTTMHHYPHGHAVALTFPFCFELNTSSAKLSARLNHAEYAQRISRLLELLDCPADADRALFMARYINSIGLTTRPFTESEFRPVVEALNPERTANNPVPFDEEVKTALVEHMKKIIL